MTLSTWHLGVCSYCHLNGVLTLPLREGAIGHNEIQFNLGISLEGLGKFAKTNISCWLKLWPQVHVQ
jgi:hypothetical protein